MSIPDEFMETYFKRLLKHVDGVIEALKEQHLIDTKNFEHNHSRRDFQVQNAPKKSELILNRSS
jgi:hypothetical protein